MNICGCLAHISKSQAETAAQTLRATSGVEIHAQAEDGRFVIVVEDTPDRLASEIIMDLHQIPGVISLTLTYHHFEEPADTAPHPDAQSPTTSRRLMS